MAAAELVGSIARRLSEASEEDAETGAVIRSIRWCALVVLVLLSAMFTGLNVSLMCLDSSQLTVLVKSAQEREQDEQESGRAQAVPSRGNRAAAPRAAAVAPGVDWLSISSKVCGALADLSLMKKQAAYAGQILPFRKDGNMLMCTLQLGAVMVNAGVVVLLANAIGSTRAFLVGTPVLLILCEILPHAICDRHGLSFGAKLLPVVRLLRCLFMPVTKPLALLLDCTFGQGLGQLLDNQQFMALIDYKHRQAPHLFTEQESKILHGSMSFAKRRVDHIMLPLRRCVCLDANAIMNAELCSSVAAAGYSRVPVVERNPFSPKGGLTVTGLLHVKDLLLLDLRHQVTVKTLLPLIGRNVFVIDDDSPLPMIMEEFRKGASQLAVVRKFVNDEDCDPYPCHVGILTLQDLLNVIIQDDIAEADVAPTSSRSGAAYQVHILTNVSQFPLPRQGAQPPTALAFDTAQALLAPARGLAQVEADAVASFFCRSHQEAFRGMEHGDIKQFLLEKCVVVAGPQEQGSRRRSPDLALYCRGDEADFATLVLGGDLLVRAGAEGLESTQGPWSFLGKRCLEKASASVPSPYVPDFTAIFPDDSGPSDGTKEPLRLLLLPAETRM